MLRIEYAYWLIAAFLLYTGLRNLRERHGWHAAFWLVLGTLFGGGDYVLSQQASGNALPAQLAGIGVIVLALLAPRLHRHAHVESSSAAQRLQSAVRLGHKLFVPALLIPLVTLLVALFGAHLSLAGHGVFAAPQMTLTGLALACLVALFAAAQVAHAPMRDGVAEGRRLLDAIGWAALLPLLLAALGEVFTQSGVGAAIAALAGTFLPTGSAFACLLAFALGMVLFTVIMGNAFAAFPVMMAGIGLPLLIHQHGAHPAILGSMGMLCGYCGTLLTPMAADFNLVPAALLELRSPYAVIRAQVWSALAILATTFVLMWLLVFR
jgi:Predicted membrane protein